MRALIDGDILVYSCGFASDQRTYIVDKEEFKYKKEALAYCEATKIDPLIIEKRIVAEPVEYTLHSVKQTVTSIIKATHSDIASIYLTGTGNYREEVAITHKYKGNRDASHKPIHYEEIKKYLITMGAEVVNGMEADDAIAIVQYEDISKYDYEKKCSDDYTSAFANTIICSLDKDFNQIAGWHYNWRTREKYWVDELEGHRFFWTQMLTGDSADNIKGIDKIGPKRAKLALEGASGKEEMRQIVEDIYMGVYGNNERFMENAQLLWLRRTPLGS